MASKAKILASQIFRHGIGKGWCSRDPAADLKGQLTPPPVAHHPSIEPDELPALLEAISGYTGDAVTKLGLKLMAHTFLRTSELIGAEWQEIDQDGAQWLVPGSRMKMNRDHIIPLSRQSLAILSDLRAINGSKQFVFSSPNGRGKPISTNTLLFALYRLGYHSRMTGHGFRSVASTLLNEAREAGLHEFSAEIIEFQLAHVETNKIRGAYNRSQYLKPRAAMMQYYSDCLDDIETVLERLKVA